MSQILHRDDTKAIAIPQVFSENSQAKNTVGKGHEYHRQVQKPWLQVFDLQ